MSKIVGATWTHIDRSERVRMALMSGFSFVLGLTFLALLVADQARAAF
jgi:hypothetical protein